VWADVETTGLEDDAGLLEVAVVVTDSGLNVCGTPVSVVLRAPWAQARMNETVRAMHTASGLLADCAEATATLIDAQDLIMDYVSAWVAPGVSPLCGSTIFFDRRMIARNLPVLNAYLHYRHIDVSTLKELVRRWFPPVYAALPRNTGTAADGGAGGAAHRALPDILDSIAELRFYREQVFADALATMPALLSTAPSNGG